MGLTLMVTGVCLAEGDNLLLDDFEISVSNGPEGTVDFGSGNGSTVEVTAANDIKNTNFKHEAYLYKGYNTFLIYFLFQ